MSFIAHVLYLGFIFNSSLHLQYTGRLQIQHCLRDGISLEFMVVLESIIFGIILIKISIWYLIFDIWYLVFGMRYIYYLYIKIIKD
jgi:hypothetical protein